MGSPFSFVSFRGLFDCELDELLVTACTGPCETGATRAVNRDLCTRE